MTRSVETVLVVGCGSIGRRHLRNLKSLGVPTLLGVDPRPDRREQAREESGAVTMATLDEAWERRPSAVVVATPSAHHMPAALEAARHGCAVFVEKPISHSMDQVDELIDLTARQGLVTMVGCNYRFDKSLNMVKSLIDEGMVGTVASVRAEFGIYLPQVHPYEHYRDFYAAHASLGGGVILDRTHELDYLRWIFGDVADLACLHARRSDLDIDTEDVAEVLLRFTSGVIGSIHLDYLQGEYRCVARVVGDRGVLEWNFNPQLVRVYSLTSKEWKTLLDVPKPDVNAMYVEELRYFLECVGAKTQTCNNFAEGKKLLELLLRCKREALVAPS